MKKYQCECCGGTINPATGKCDYCGTVYRIEADKVFRIETYTSPIETICATAVLQDYEVRTLGLEEASRLAVIEITHRLAEGLAPFIKVDMEHDIEFMQHKIRGTLKVVIPKG